MSLNTIPRTFVTSEVETAAIFNAELRDAVTGIEAAWTADARSAATIWTAATTNPVIGNGTVASRYRQIGKTVDWEVTVTAGSTTTFGTGAWQLVLPFTAASAFTGLWVVRAYDNSLSSTVGWTSAADLINTTTLQLRTLPATLPNNDRLLTTTVPFTWAISDVLYMAGRFEAA